MSARSTPTEQKLKIRSAYTHHDDPGVLPLLENDDKNCICLTSTLVGDAGLYLSVLRVFNALRRKEENNCEKREIHTTPTVTTRRQHNTTYEHWVVLYDTHHESIRGTLVLPCLGYTLSNTRPRTSGDCTKKRSLRLRVCGRPYGLLEHIYGAARHFVVSFKILCSRQ